MDDAHRLRRVRAVLYEWGRAGARIAALMDQQRAAMCAMAEIDEDIGGRAPADGQPRSTVPGDPVWRAYQARERLREVFADDVETCRREIEAIISFRRDMGEMINSLPPVRRDVVILRYADGATWLYIGYRLHMDESTARRHDRAACEALADMIVMRD